jgi:hypothetical protein
MIFNIFTIINNQQSTISLHPLAPEIYQQAYTADNCEYPPDKIAVLVFKLGHELEIHTVNPGDESQRDENRGKYCQGFHHVVHLVIHVSVVDVQLVGRVCCCKAR